MNIGIKKGLMNANDYLYRNFKIKEPKSNRLDLSFGQLEELEKLVLKNRMLDETRDLFLFSCYTGLRYEDVKALRHDDLYRQRNQVELRITVIKTKEELRLPLDYLFNGKAIKILEKYEKRDDKLALPQYANQTVNRNLKVIAHLISFKGILFFHLARHTFGSRLAELKPDPYLIRELMGHKDIKTSMIYIKTSGRVVENKLKEINW